MTMHQRLCAWVLACAASGCVESGAVLGSAELGAPSQTVVTALESRSVQALSASEEHGCAVSEGRAYCWGDNTYGQLGTGSDATRAGPTALPGSEWQQIVAGDAHTCALDFGGDGLISYTVDAAAADPFTSLAASRRSPIVVRNDVLRMRGRYVGVSGRVIQ